MDVFIDDRCNGQRKNDWIELLEKVVKEAVDLEQFPLDFEIGISLVTPEEIQELNHQYRGKDQVTDVLSFPIYEETDPEPVQLGDIVICLERAKEQAEEYGHSLERELCFLTAHGMLHLMGYDHMEEKEMEKMQKKEKEIMQRIHMPR
ncbi:rRNA maturation RNase YbeY [Alkalibacter rhizosphaerae]|uniref:Endoribonuclease YbeY n=1 Tax=Alkalibacter rhizosphaerae TaxID=2815577 RepID=A0A975AIC6_9FIRM|nr:rRNA maturation RNase YbeY [Alkalibacter rhizosphaerae]QSX08395.1 rRNA maturation RNase YbeY [Alkalibacter rhizosphaerae]